jgi:hypothetical protein
MPPAQCPKGQVWWSRWLRNYSRIVLDNEFRSFGASLSTRLRCPPSPACISDSIEWADELDQSDFMPVIGGLDIQLVSLLSHHPSYTQTRPPILLNRTQTLPFLNPQSLIAHYPSPISIAFPCPFQSVPLNLGATLLLNRPHPPPLWEPLDRADRGNGRPESEICSGE